MASPARKTLSLFHGGVALGARVNGWVNRFLIAVAGVALAGLMFLTAANVAMRIFKHPYIGAYELAGYLGAVSVALALGHTQVRKDHVAVDLLTRHYPNWLTRVIDVLSSGAGLVFFGAVGWRMVDWGLRLRQSGEVSETLKIVFDPFIYAVGFGFFMLAVALILDLLTAILPARKPAS